jgi:hypothetical protein
MISYLRNQWNLLLSDSPVSTLFMQRVLWIMTISLVFIAGYYQAKSALLEQQNVALEAELESLRPPTVLQ